MGWSHPDARLAELDVFDADGEQLVTRWWLLANAPDVPKNGTWTERVAHLPEPAGRLGCEPVWRRSDIDGRRLFT
jgi:hypothetical protein